MSFESKECNIEANKNNLKSFPTSHASEHQWGKPGPAAGTGSCVISSALLALLIRVRQSCWRYKKPKLKIQET
jgi:hypothetical protein